MTTLQQVQTLGPELARTMEHNPRATIQPRQLTAIDSVRFLAARTAVPLVLGTVLGEGGMGIVHNAIQGALGREVAVKTTRPGSVDPNATVKLLREAWITGALEHPNVVPVYDVSLDPTGRPLIVMRRIEGVEWTALMHKPADIARLFDAHDPIEWNLRILSQVCNAVHFAHSRGILHRDLKPENVMIGAFGEVYVLDWGLAVSLRPDPTGRLPLASEATELVGTPAYMAPEMVETNASLLSERTDVYLLGGIFYEVFAATPPHQGDNLQAMLSAILLSEPPFPQGFPHEAEQIARCALQRDPLQRFASAEVLRRAIDAYLRHRDSRRLARDARTSADTLLRKLAEAPSEDRALAIYNLLGECRFGYREALAAWEENEAARKGLDRTLAAVIEYELNEGDPNAAAVLLREVSVPPLELATRVETEVRKRAVEDERLRKLSDDLDPTIGTRTRTFVGGLFGAAWTVVPLVSWGYVELLGGQMTHTLATVPSVVVLLFGVLILVWARETLTRTQLNRRLTAVIVFQLGAQIALGVGAMLAGLGPMQSELLHVFAWFMTASITAIFVERIFMVAAGVDLVVFLVGARWPVLLFPLMALANFVLTVLLLSVWLPRQDFAWLRQRRAELMQRRRRLLGLSDEPWSITTLLG
jgi:serine/threonine-protein kinase